MPLKRLVELSHPVLEMDQLGDLVGTSRCLHPDLLSPTQRYFSSDGKLYIKVKQDKERIWLDEIKKEDALTEIKLDREMNLEEKIETYAWEFWDKLEADESVDVSEDESVDESADEEEEEEDSENLDKRSKKENVIKPRKLWGARGCPGYLRVRNWIKCMTKSSQGNAEDRPAENIVVEDEDPCADVHSEGCLSFRDDNEEERTFTKGTFEDAVHYAFYMTFFDDNPGKTRRIYTDPAIVFRMFLSKYLHSDQEKEKACKIMNKAAKEKPRFCKAIRPFLTALREGNADATPTKKDYVSLYQGLKKPEEIVELELEQREKSELRTGKLQEVMKMWLDKPYFRSVKTSSSLIDTADEKSSDSNYDEDYPSKSDKEEIRKNHFKRCQQTARHYLKKYKNVMKYQNYMQKVDVSLKKKEIILLCFSDSLHYVGKIRHDDIEDLIQTAEKYVKGDKKLMKNNFKILCLVIPLINDLLEERNKRENKKENSDKEQKLEELTRALENVRLSSQVCSKENHSLEVTSQNNVMNKNTKASVAISTKTKEKEYEFHRTNFSVKELRNYILHNSNNNLFLPNTLKYDKKFEVLVCKKHKKLFTIPKYYKYGRWSKYSKEELKCLLKIQDPTYKKHDYIIQYGSYALKGEEKVIKKCLLSLNLLGVQKKDLKLALLLYAKIQFKDSEESTYDELIEQREKFKALYNEWILEIQMKNLEERIMGYNNVKQESWLINDPDYHMKTFISGKEKRKKRYETFFNSSMKIKEEDKHAYEKSLNVDLEDFRYYNYHLDYNFMNANDFSSEEGDENENHFLDNLCSCGMAKEECNLSETHKSSKQIQIEYHYGDKHNNGKVFHKYTETNKSSPIHSIKLTSFRGGQKFPQDNNNNNLVKTDFISTDSMLQLHSVFDHGIQNFNKEHVAQVVDFIKATEEGKEAELSLNVQEIKSSETFIESRVNESFKKSEVSQKNDTEDNIDVNSLEIAENFLRTEYYIKSEIPKQENIIASEQVLQMKYLERVFNYVQKFS